jgi:hypothetical protein
MSWELALLCSLVLSCAAYDGEPMEAESPEGAKFTSLLASVEQTPEDTLALCEPLTDPALEGECIVAGVEALDHKQTSLALDLCASINTEMERDECFFRVAERSARPDLCSRSALFEQDCLMHLWTRSLRSSIEPDALPSEIEAEVAVQALEYGFDPSDTRPWVALYRVVLGQMKPMDRVVCDAIEEPERAEICRTTGLALFHDRLNHIRDRGLFSCDGGALPEVLNTQLDPELKHTLDERIARDLCP